MFKDMIMHDQSNSVNKVGVLLLHFEASFMYNINTVFFPKSISIRQVKKIK